MIAKAKIYKGYVYICASRKQQHIRVPAGIKIDRLNSSGLLHKSCGLDDIDEKNRHIRELTKKVQAALDDHPKLTAKEIATYVKTGALPAAREAPRQLTFIECFEKFVADSKSGARANDKGVKLSVNTVKSYQSVLSNLYKFQKMHSLDWDQIDDSFYHKLCDYYWTTLDCYDNHTGKAVKIITTCLNWAYDSGLIPVAVNTKKWKVWKEDIEILVLYPDEIKLLHKMPTEDQKVERTKDTFLMGVFTCLRVENLLGLTEKDLQVLNGEYFIHTIVQKTRKPIRIKLNPVAVAIIEKYRHQYRTLLPAITSVKFNENLKDMAKAFKKHLDQLKEQGQLDIIGNNWHTDVKRVRTKKGQHHYEFVKPEKFISSHCMRRSGITSFLMLGMTPLEVQEISGHASNSKDFSKYVKLAKQVVEQKSVDVWSNALI